VRPVLVYRLAGVVSDVDLPALVLQRHPDQIRKGTFVVDEKDPDRRSVGTIHPRQLAEDGTTSLVVAGRRRRHLTILAILQLQVTNLIDISNVTPDLVVRPHGRSSVSPRPCEGAAPA